MADTDSHGDTNNDTPGDSNKASGAALAGPRPGVHQGRERCRSLLREALCSLGSAETSPRTAPRLAWLVDQRFGDWPLDEPAVLDSLARWLRPGGRSLRIVGVDFTASAQALPRFARWRRDWSHRIEVFAPVDGLLPGPLRGLVAGGCAWQWLDAPDWRLRTLTEAVQVRAVAEQLADFLQRCEPAWPVTTVGL